MYAKTMQSQQRQTGKLYSFLAALVVVTLALVMTTTNAQAETVEVTEYDSGLVVSELSDGSTQVNVDGEVFTVVTNEATGVVTVTEANGEITKVPLADGDVNSAAQVDDLAPASNNPLLCSTLITIAELINDFGWGLAIAVAISNPVTAAAAGVVGAWGASYFWSYLRSNC